jgi:glyoxylase-like metal-dependent hydrolase (beta-lactamase superfamily II)
MMPPATPDASGSFARELAPGVHWMGWCQEPTTEVFGETVHVHVSNFLVEGTDRALLYDTSLPLNWPAMESQLDAALGGRPLDWIVPSHPEIPHCGNLGHLLRKYPHAKVVGDVRDYHLFFPEVAGRSEPWPSGYRADLGGGYEFTLLDAPVRDGANTVWGHEAKQQVLFTADAYSFTHFAAPRPSPGSGDGPGTSSDDDDTPVHRPGQCSLTWREIGRLPNDAQAIYITKAALYWTRYVDFGPFIEAVADILREYPTRFVAPAHGNVVDNVGELMPIIEEAHRRAYQEGPIFSTS